MGTEGARIVVTGATGFVGTALRDALAAAGRHVVAGARNPASATKRFPRDRWVRLDFDDAATLAPALAGARSAFYLVHAMAAPGFRQHERAHAERFAAAADAAGLERVVYLGGVAPSGRPSEHLASRLEVGEILRAGRVPTLELRASMIVGAGSTSWQIARDLAFRLPGMVVPKWLDTRTCPVAVDDVVAALVAALDLPLATSAWFDLPGPDVLTMRAVLERVAALRGLAPPMMRVPLLTPGVSSWWLALVTRANFRVARELVLGLTSDLVPRDGRYWELVGRTPMSFDAAARLALVAEPSGSRLAKLEELAVSLLGRRSRA